MLLVLGLSILTEDYCETAAVLISGNRLSIISFSEAELNKCYRNALQGR